MGRVFLQGSRSTLYQGLAQFVSLALLRWGDKVATENRGRGSVCRNMGELWGGLGGKNYMPRKKKTVGWVIYMAVYYPGNGNYHKHFMT